MTTGSMTLTADTPAAARTARTAFMEELDRWECGRVADALLVFSELVTNAVNHGGGATRIDVVHGDKTLRFEVHDTTRRVPQLRDIAGPAGGFGLRIVDQVSEGWGWEHTASGKVVWCAVRCCIDD